VEKEEKPGIPVECEATLLICSEQPGKIIKEIDRITTVAGYRVKQGDSGLLHDHYMDLPDCALGKQGWVLRLRRTNSDWRIALKGPSRATDFGVTERLELELSWSSEALHRVMSVIDDLPRSTSIMPVDCADPVMTMTALGFMVIQRRVIERRVKNILPVLQDVILAELVIDSVTFELSPGKIRHHEIEIESKDKEYCSVLEMVVTDLLDRFPSELRVWRIGKLATGKAIEALYRQGRLDGLVREDGCLHPGAYDRIERLDRDFI
jgi:hypothetical protein